MRSAVALTAFLLTASGAAAAKDSAPAWRLVFSSARTGVAQVYTVPPSGHGLAQLTFGTQDVGAPVPSPDGRMVIYTLFGTLHLMAANGRADVALAAGHEAAWSRDSALYAYVTPNADVAVAAPGGAPRIVSAGGPDANPAWARDRALAFVRVNVVSGRSDVVVRRGGVERVVAHASVARALAWSPNGRLLAYAFENGGSSGVAVVGGSAPRAVYLASDLSPRPRALAWSPDGRRLAFDDGSGVGLADLNGHVTRLATLPVAGLAWSPRGDALAVAGGGRVSVVSLRGRVRSVFFTDVRDDALTTVAWAPLPHGTRLRPPQPVLPVVESDATELRARFEIPFLTANGDTAAYRVCPFATEVWTPGVPPLGPAPTECRLSSRSPGLPYMIALARAPRTTGDRLAWLSRSGGIGVFGALDVLANATQYHVADTLDCCAGDPTLPPLGYLLGGADELVYSTWTRCREDCSGDDVSSGYPGVPAKIATETIYRLDPPATPVQIATASGAYEPFAFDGERLVVRRHLTGIDVLSPGGRVLLSWELGARMLGADVGGNDLVVLVPGELRDYDATSGDLRRTFPMPAAQRGGGFCGRLFCANADVLLQGAAGGFVAYTFAGDVHVLDLRTGAERLDAVATSARLTAAGLFYAYKGKEPWPGRIRFVPLPQLRR